MVRRAPESVWTLFRADKSLAPPLIIHPVITIPREIHFEVNVASKKCRFSCVQTTPLFSVINSKPWKPSVKNIELFHQLTLMHNFLYSLTICLLHYYSRHVSSINMPIFGRKNCIHTASGIFALCKRLHSTLVNTIFPPEDGHVNARNMSRIIV